MANETELRTDAVFNAVALEAIKSSFGEDAVEVAGTVLIGALVAGIEPFEATDELYLCEYTGDLVPLLETRFTGSFQGYEENEWPDDEPRLVAYTHAVGEGEVLYITLGHCCGAYDMRPIQPIAEVVRGSWENPVFIELLRRGLRWATKSL